MPHDARSRARVLSNLYVPVRTTLSELGCDLNELKTGSNGVKGVFVIVEQKNDDYWELFSTREFSNGHYQIIADHNACSHFGISSERADALAETASSLTR